MKKLKKNTIKRKSWLFLQLEGHKYSSNIIFMTILTQNNFSFCHPQVTVILHGPCPNYNIEHLLNVCPDH